MPPVPAAELVPGTAYVIYRPTFIVRGINPLEGPYIFMERRNGVLKFIYIDGLISAEFLPEGKIFYAVDDPTRPAGVPNRPPPPPPGPLPPMPPPPET